MVLFFRAVAGSVEAGIAALFCLADAQGAVIEQHMPKNQPSPERADDRRIISGILHVLTSGCRWQDCPSAYRQKHLRAFAQRIEVAEDEIRIMGSKSELPQSLVPLQAGTRRVLTFTVLYQNGAPERIRTSDPQIRSLVLYPAELRAPFLLPDTLEGCSSSFLVGVAGFEPATPTSRTWCATRLRYTPMPAPEGRRAGL